MEIHQLLTCLSYGDAIGNYALQMRDIFRQWGYMSEIYAEESHPQVRKEVLPFKSYLDNRAGKNDLILYHFSVGSMITHYLKKISGTKIMIYHNITPHQYFITIHPYLVEQIVNGRHELRRFATLFDMVIADSEYNKQDLEEYGYKHVECVPVIPSLTNLDTPPDGDLMELLRDGRKNILFVGRVTPNKGHADLIKSFYYLNKSGQKNTRLIIVGEYRGFEKYYWWLEDLCKKLNLDNVMFTGMVDYEDLTSYYRCADLFVCLSRHEGFCVPLLEAMYFEIPVLALASTAVPYTLRNSGISCNSSIHYHEISELMSIMLEDAQLRKDVVAKQNEVMEYYRSYDMESRMKTLLSPYLS